MGNGYRPSGCGTRVRAVIPTVAAISRTRSPDNPNWRPIAENGVAVVRTARMIASSRTARPPPPWVAVRDRQPEPKNTFANIGIRATRRIRYLPPRITT